MRDHAWYRTIIERQKRVCDEFIRRPVYVSPIKQVYEYKMYTCPKHDLELVYDETEPFRHRCRVDTAEFYSGGKYDMAWAGWYNRLLASRLVWLGVLYQLYDDERYAEAGRQILTRFADLYLQYPTSNTILGPAHVFFGTLSESFWGVDMAYGYDLLASSPKFTAAEHRKIKEQLFYPLATITQQFPESASNRQLWYNNVSAAVGFLYNDQKLIDFALRGRYGFYWQLGSALPESGFWPEWSGYHYVALRGMIHLAEMARHNGIDLYHVKIAGRTMKAMFDAPFGIVLPNHEFPRLKDSGGGNILEYAPYYEVGYAVYRDPRYLPILHRTNVLRGTQVVGETSALGEDKSPVTIFNLVPDLPPSDAPIPPEYSVHLEGNGFAALRSGTGADLRYLYLDYGIMGGEHGHPDRLQIGYYANGRNWIVDPLNESYFNPNLQLWYRQTIAHMTPVLDQTSQTWTNGEPLFFGAVPSLQVASGMSATTYPGSAVKRTVIQVGDYFVDLVDVEGPDRRTIDWPLQSFGSLTLQGLRLTPEPRDLFGHEPGIPGYDQLREIRSAETADAWSGVFSDDGGHLSVMAAGEPGTRVFQAIAPTIGGFYKQMVKERNPMPIVISRRIADTTRFAHLIHAYRDKARVRSFARSGNDEYEVIHAEGTDRIMADVPGRSYAVVRTSGSGIRMASGFNVSAIAVEGRTVVESDVLLPSIECRWDGARLVVNVDSSWSVLRILAQGATGVVVNGVEQKTGRSGEQMVVRQRQRPVLVPAVLQAELHQGMNSALAVRVVNPTEDTVRGTIRVRLPDDWEERARSQLEWWGGVVNLLPLNKGTVRRTVAPSKYPLEPDWFRGISSDPLILAPGESRDVRLAVNVPNHAPPVAFDLTWEFAGAVRTQEAAILPPVTAGLKVPNGSPLRFEVTLTNTTEQELDVRASLEPHEAWSVRGERTFHAVLGPGEKKTVAIPVLLERPSPVGQYYPVRISVSADGFSTTIERDLYAGVAHRTAAPPSLDGSWRGWDRSMPVNIDQKNQVHKLLLGNQPWGGVKDLSAKIYAMYDDEYLYVGADVQDQTNITTWGFPAMSYPWDTDCMEVVVDTRLGADQGSDPPTPGLFRHLSLAEYRKTEFPKERWQGAGAGGPLIPKPLLVPNAETYYTKTASGYVLICRYPRASFPTDLFRPGNKIGFDVAVNDNDGATYRKNVHIWAGSTSNQTWWDMGSIGMLVFK